jgi:hypothetical protein
MYSTTLKKGHTLKKLLSILALSTLTLVLSTGCASKGSSDAHSGTHITTKQIHHAVMVAGKKAGWTMTEFKGNEIIAEKFDDGQGEMVTVKIHDGRVSYHGDASYGDLEDAVYDELHSEKPSH